MCLNDYSMVILFYSTGGGAIDCDVIYSGGNYYLLSFCKSCLQIPWDLRGKAPCINSIFLKLFKKIIDPQDGIYHNKASTMSLY